MIQFSFFLDSAHFLMAATDCVGGVLEGLVLHLTGTGLQLYQVQIMSDKQESNRLR